MKVRKYKKALRRKLRGRFNWKEGQLERRVKKVQFAFKVTRLQAVGLLMSLPEPVEKLIREGSDG